METRTYHEWSQNYKYENGAFGVFGQRVLPSVCIAQTARRFRTAGI